MQERLSVWGSRIKFNRRDIVLRTPVGLAAFFLDPATSGGSSPSPVLHEVQDTISQRNFCFAVLASLHAEGGCACDVAMRIKISSASFLLLLERDVRDCLDTLCGDALLERRSDTGCLRGCSNRYRLTPTGAEALRDFIRQVNACAMVPLATAQRCIAVST